MTNYNPNPQAQVRPAGSRAEEELVCPTQDPDSHPGHRRTGCPYSARRWRFIRNSDGFRAGRIVGVGRSGSCGTGRTE
ncbi:MAG: hypothetical protein U5O16_12235 [Rhodococcus sp. (in: high G+C Gram-positive bacteria)]|uniref:hypothetical protein n=1 Tax=Rhodococcus sp. TaxID=1831 RepID=UPI002ADCA1D8|nr:hypothetical protein [Rhodococcus sp. (in: high G+C Gram-positive bacteria)]